MLTSPSIPNNKSHIPNAMYAMIFTFYFLADAHPDASRCVDCFYSSGGGGVTTAGYFVAIPFNVVEVDRRSFTISCA